MVYVIAGDSRGQQGKVLAVDPEKQRAIVEGVNMCKKAEKPNAKNPQGGIVEKEAPIHISNLQVLDPKSGKPTRVGRKELRMWVACSIYNEPVYRVAVPVCA